MSVIDSLTAGAGPVTPLMQRGMPIFRPQSAGANEAAARHSATPPARFY